ncbi:unnamed protein product, partial [Ectocarpus sp. 13 AM-2016]
MVDMGSGYGGSARLAAKTLGCKICPYLLSTALKEVDWRSEKLITQGDVSATRSSPTHPHVYCINVTSRENDVNRTLS